MIVFDYHCEHCGYDFEQFVRTPEEEVPCSLCGLEATRHMPAPKPAHLRMGVDPMSSSADIWARAREDKIRRENKLLEE